MRVKLGIAALKSMESHDEEGKKKVKMRVENEVWCTQ